MRFLHLVLQRAGRGSESSTVNAKLGWDAHELLDEANAWKLTQALDVRDVATLIGKLLDCADQARDVQLTDIEQRLREAAENLEGKLSSA
jgi:hypothetical protein